MGKLNIQGDIDIHNYLSATSTDLYLSSASSDYSIRFRAGTKEFIRFQQSQSATGANAGKINALYIMGASYGNDSTYTKVEGQLSIGDPGPQIIFSASASLASDYQPLALIYSNHDSIFAGNSLSLVSSESECAFIAPTIKALTKFIGTLDGNATTATTLSATLTVDKGGTGRTTLTSGYALIGNGTSAVSLREITTSVTSGNTALITSGAVYSKCANYLPLSGGAMTGNISYANGSYTDYPIIKLLLVIIMALVLLLVVVAQLFLVVANQLLIQ